MASGKGKFAQRIFDANRATRAVDGSEGRVGFQGDSLVELVEGCRGGERGGERRVCDGHAVDFKRSRSVQSRVLALRQL